jgi:hypothetical protein
MPPPRRCNRGALGAVAAARDSRLMRLGTPTIFVRYTAQEHRNAARRYRPGRPGGCPSPTPTATKPRGNPNFAIARPARTPCTRARRYPARRGIARPARTPCTRASPRRAHHRPPRPIGPRPFARPVRTPCTSESAQPNAAAPRRSPACSPSPPRTCARLTAPPLPPPRPPSHRGAGQKPAEQNLMHQSPCARPQQNPLHLIPPHRRPLTAPRGAASNTSGNAATVPSARAHDPAPRPAQSGEAGKLRAGAPLVRVAAQAPSGASPWSHLVGWGEAAALRGRPGLPGLPPAVSARMFELVSAEGRPEASATPVRR